MQISKKLEKSISKLESWIDKNGWAGYDLYDIQCAFFLHKMIRYHPIFKRLHSYVFHVLNKYLPKLSRKILRINPHIDAMALGLLIDGYCNRYQIKKEDKYLTKAKLAAKWLLKNNNKNYDHLCWGHPFNWQSSILLPKGTPSGVVGTKVGNSLWNLYKITNNIEYLNACESICKFLLKYLKVTRNENGICFNYTPIDNFQVHNANLLNAEFLIRIGTKIGNKKWIEIGKSAASFSVSEQRENGSICYNTNEYRKKYNITCKVDHYHTGFEIRALTRLWELTGDKKYFNAMNKYFEFYKTNFFAKDYAPLLRPNGVYYINSHACSEALLCNSLVSKYIPEAKNLLINTSKWIICNMQTEEGWFVFDYIKTAVKTTIVATPYLRWQGWMLYGLSEALKTLNVE